MKERRQGESLEIHGLSDSVVGRIEGSWVLFFLRLRVLVVERGAGVV
jgi:hypothetical protein